MSENQKTILHVMARERSALADGEADATQSLVI
jgi:hypothetical protein